MWKFKKPKFNCLFPSTKYLNKVMETNQNWIENCIHHPFTHHPTNTKIHVLGYLPISLPVLHSLPFSSKNELFSHSQVAVNELYQTYADDDNPNKFTIIVNESVEQMKWMLHDYKPFFKDCIPNSIDINEYMEYLQAKLYSRIENIDFTLDIPTEYTEMMSSGFIPYLEPVEAIEQMQSFLLPGSPLEITAHCVKQDHSLELQHAQDKIMKLEDFQELDLKSELASFYSTCCDMEPSEMIINTESHVVNNIIQKMIINPNDFPVYEDIIRGAGGNLKNRVMLKTAKELVNSEHIVDHLMQKLDGRIICLVIERDLYGKIRNLLYQNGLSK